jgi:hypothetical protein
MTASITITLSDEIIRILEKQGDLTLALDATGAARAPGATGAAFREGSLPAKLVQWAQGRKRPFGVRDVMKALRVKRAHASMVLTRVAGSGHLRRVGRGAYVAA